MIKKSKAGQVTLPSQGGHTLNKISQKDIDRVIDHIRSFPCVDSHYCRAQVKRKYLYPGLSVKEMHRLYVEKCNKENTSHVKQHTYYQIFNKNFNLGFFRPKKDQCDTCTAFKNTKNPTHEEKQAQNEHITNKVKAREIKK